MGLRIRRIEAGHYAAEALQQALLSSINYVERVSQAS